MGYFQKQTVKWPEGIWLIFWCFLHTFHWFDPKKLGKHQPKEGNTMIQLASDLISVFWWPPLELLLAKCSFWLLSQFLLAKHHHTSFPHFLWPRSMKIDPHLTGAERKGSTCQAGITCGRFSGSANPIQILICIWLVVSNMFFFHNIWDNRIILPIDELIFFKMVIAPAWLKAAPLSTRRNV